RPSRLTVYTQPLRDSLHRPQVPGSVVQAEGQATYSASTPASWRWWPQQKQTEDFHVAPQAHHRGDAPAEEPRGPICEGDGRRQEDPGANPADQGDAQEPAGPRSRSSATKSATLAKLNDELLRIIQDVEDSTALNVRELLHQQDTLANVVNILEYSNKRRLQQLKSEIQEWEEKENQKMSCLERQVQHLEAQNKKTQDQVNFLSTYMDHEYPVKLVQLASLGRQVQQAKDRQQDELDDFSELRRKVLASVYAKIQEKQQRILRAVAVKTQRPHQEALLRKTQESQFMQKFMWRFRDFIGQLEEELPVLRQEVGALQAQVWDPREVVFADVLLRRPKCTPDMDVLINMPVEEPLPF
uniref:Chromosome 20 open reading frame 96 n=1 Tax=Oryctolagus cuniculus TaxID=9986 RepID=G1TZ46_RABIT